jgi:hypothetical protein
MQKLQQEKNLAFHIPVLQNICLIIPKQGATLSPKDAETKKKIELAGMKAVIQYETEQLRTPTDVSLEFVGYDLKSTSNEEIRYIEVKAFENTGIVEMTENEWKTAQKLKDNYWLYVIENALNAPKKKIFTIRNPSERFKEVKIIRQETRYLISDWKTKV